MRGVRPAEQPLEIVGRRAIEVRFESPLVLRGKAPAVEFTGELEPRQRTATCRAGAFEAELLGRVGDVTFHLVRAQPAIAHLEALDMTDECGAINRPEHAPLPLGAASDSF